MLALEAGTMPGGTRERLRELLERGTLGQRQTRDLMASFDYLVHMRLRNQVAAIGEVKHFQSFLEQHFRVNLIL